MRFFFETKKEAIFSRLDEPFLRRYKSGSGFEIFAKYGPDPLTHLKSLEVCWYFFESEDYDKPTRNIFRAFFKAVSLNRSIDLLEIDNRTCGPVRSAIPRIWCLKTCPLIPFEHNLREFRIRQSEIDARTVQCFALALEGKHNFLEDIELGNCSIEGEPAGTLIDIFANNCNLLGIKWRTNNNGYGYLRDLSKNGFRALVHLINCHLLEELNLTPQPRKGIRLIGAGDFARALSTNTMLKNINLGQRRYDDRGGSFFGQNEW